VGCARDNLRRERGAHVHVRPRFSTSIYRVRVNGAHSCFVHVEGGRSIVLASRLLYSGGWVGIEFIAYAAGILIEPTTTRRHIQRRSRCQSNLHDATCRYANDENKSRMTTIRLVVERSSETRIVPIGFRVYIDLIPSRRGADRGGGRRERKLHLSATYRNARVEHARGICSLSTMRACNSLHAARCMFHVRALEAEASR